MGRRSRFSVVHILVVLVVVSSLFFTPFNAPALAAGPTSVSGPIAANTAWTAANSPYIVTGNVLVMSGARLTIEPGVVVKFNAGRALQIDGELVARGTEVSSIIFTSNLAVPAPGDWAYILFTNTAVDATYDAGGNYVSGSIIECATVEYAGSTIVDNNGAIWLQGAHPFISSNTIRNNKIYGVSASSLTATLKIDLNCIDSNQMSGIYIFGNNSAIISNNEITNNYGHPGAGIFADGAPTIRNNHIAYNDAGWSNGGGILASGNATIIDNVITDNRTGNSGGGIYGATGEVSGNLIADNQAALGGGIYYGARLSAMANIANNRIVGNVASEEGGGIYWALGPAVMGYNVIAENSILGNSAPRSSAAYLKEFYGEFRDNAIIGNWATGPSPTYTLFVHNVSTPLIDGNNIYDNSAIYELWNGKLAGQPVVYAKNNWWGTADSAEVQDKVFDYFDDATHGSVDFIPVLAQHSHTAPPAPPTGLIATPIGEDSVELTWDPNPEPGVGYHVHYDTDSRFPYQGTGVAEGDSPIDAGNATSFTLSGLGLGSYFVAITAYNQFGNESDYSSMVQFTLAVQGPSISGAVDYEGVIGGSHNIYVVATTSQSFPSYITSVPSPGGMYSIQGLPDDVYLVMAFLDADDNSTISPGDRVAYFDEPVYVSGGPAGADLYIDDTPWGDIWGTLDLQGREGTGEGWTWGDATVWIDDGNQTYITVPFPDGTFVVPVPSGVYDLYVEMPGFLPATRNGLVIDDVTLRTPGQEPPQLPPVTLLGGDTDWDGQVDIIDLMTIAANFSQYPYPGYDGDVNCDGTVNILDLVLVGMNFGRTESPWP